MGIQSLGASEEEVYQLGSLYMYTVEFGMTEKDGKVTCYSGGPGGCIA